MPDGYEALEGDKHRFVFKALLIENKELAHPGELVIDKKTGIIWTVDDDGNLHSKAFELAEQLKTLNDSGVIQSALAFANNAKIYTLYVSGNTCRIDSMIKLDKNIRYWAVRGIDEKTKQLIYLTGLMKEDQIENSLIDVLPFTSDPEIAFPGEAQSGTFHTPSIVKDRHPYFIDFFDADRVARASVPCQTVFVSRLDFALAPDQNIVDLEIVTSQDMVNPDNPHEQIGFIYQGQSFGSINVYVYAKYASGDKRYINHEISTSRLVLTIPKDEETIADRLEIGKTFEIQARYYAGEINTDTGEAIHDGNYFSIDKTKTVRVVEDVYTGVEYLLPVPVVHTLGSASLPGGATEVIKLHMFAKYTTEQFLDVSANAKFAHSEFSETSFGVTQTFTVSLGIGHGGLRFEQHNTQVTMSGIDKGRWDKIVVPYAPKTQIPCCVAQFDPFTNVDGIKMRFRKENLDGFATPDAFAIFGSIPGKKPTHFRVRSVIESSFVHTIIPIRIEDFEKFTISDTTNASNMLSNFQANNNGIPYPIIVEFLYQDPSNASAPFTFVTAIPFITQRTEIYDF